MRRPLSSTALLGGADGTMTSSAQPLQILRHEVEVDEPAIRLGDLSGYRARHPPTADDGLVDAPHWTDAEAGRCQEHLVGVVGVEQVPVLLDDGVAGLAR